jgi:hypothetical protein
MFLPGLVKFLLPLKEKEAIYKFNLSSCNCQITFDLANAWVIALLKARNLTSLSLVICLKVGNYLNFIHPTNRP